MRANLIAGLDIGSTKTCAVIAEVSADFRRRPELKILGVGQARTSGIRREVVTHIEETTESIRQALHEAELMAGARVDRVYAGISGEQIESRTSIGVVAVSDDEVVPGDVARVHEVARAVALPPERELIHAIPQEYSVDHQPGIKDPLGMTGTRLEAEVYLVTCAASAAQNIRKAVTRAGYRVQELVLEPLASARAVLTEDEKEVGVAMVELGGGTTDIAAYYEGKIRHVAVLPLGGVTVSRDLGKGLSVPFAEARRAKELHGVAVAQLVDPQETVELPGPAPGQRRHVARELIAHIVEQRMDEIFRLVQRELEEEDLVSRLGAGIVLTGGGAALHGAVELAQQCFAAPVRLGVPGEWLTGLADSVGRPKFATAAGLALYGGDRFVETGEGASTLASGLVTKAAAWIKEFF
ncbi:MAG: cell division protein FtsA [Gemmatimonadetes bacterium]|nr:cell division protein FtsA [Gemmatimonadota bacterium]NIR77546.1 cell division protein FtsA [Gemmatimonadota bacterium]NIT86083.1 cell division protein FtsA [Gemmatimonadota bacterium]NIU29910.1 cell division protein FtsA [Gemmatimonadota bacterium]NIV60317.1 cell division protein FtsA [Gemmatimonadota bacterium]